MADIRINALATTAASTASDDFIAIDGSANGTRKLNAFSPTFGGNLTVSGRDLTLGSSESVIFFGTSSANYLYYNGSSLFLRVASVDRITIPASTGNVLIGTNVDSSALLQVGTNTTTAAGGMKFGTDTSLYRSAAYTLKLDGGNNVTSFRVLGSGSCEALMAVASASSVLFGSTTAGASTVLCSGNGATALTLDSSQNATFAGQITASGISHKLGSGGTGSANAVLTIDGSSASSYGSYIVLQRNSTNKWQFGTYSGINGGTSDDFLLYNPTAANEALKIAAATSNATFAGSIAIGNTVNTVSPTSPNRTITMVIGGTTYYIHAKTTND